MTNKITMRERKEAGNRLNFRRPDIVLLPIKRGGRDEEKVSISSKNDGKFLLPGLTEIGEGILGASKNK